MSDKKQERRVAEAQAISHIRRTAREAEGAELQEAEAERKFGRVVGAVLNGEAEKICANCWFRLSRHADPRRDPIGSAEAGKYSGEPCAHFVPLTKDRWRERNG